MNFVDRLHYNKVKLHNAESTVKCHRHPKETKNIAPDGSRLGSADDIIDMLNMDKDNHSTYGKNARLSASNGCLSKMTSCEHPKQHLIAFTSSYKSRPPETKLLYDVIFGTQC